MKGKIITIDEALCNGCGNCVTACAEGAIKMVDGKAKLISDKYCDGLGDCLGHCPTGALKIIEREAESFDEDMMAVKDKVTSIHSCPGQSMNMHNTELNNWPIQLSLVSVDADYFADAELLIAADCTAFSYLNYHQELLRSKALLICCPKLDDTEAHLAKLQSIFAKHDIKTLTVARMSVPCCAKLMTMVRAALQLSGKKLRIQEVIIDNQGGASKEVIV